MNNILSELPKAQEAFSGSLSNLDDIDTSPIIVDAGIKIKEAIEKGYFVAQVHGYDNLLQVEKAALQLGELGYSATTCQSGVKPAENNAMQPLYGIQLNWKYMPPNVRDVYSL